MSTIVLRDVEKDGNYYYLEAVLEKEKLTIQGHDVGHKVQAFWGDSDYEYWYEFDEWNTEQLFKYVAEEKGDRSTEAVSEDEKRLLETLKAWMGEAADESKLRKLCEEKGIKYKFFSY